MVKFGLNQEVLESGNQASSKQNDSLQNMCKLSVFSQMKSSNQGTFPSTKIQRWFYRAIGSDYSLIK